MPQAGAVNDLLNPLSSDLWFGRLDVGERRMLLSRAESMSLLPGAYAYRRGGPPDGIYALVSGLLKASTLREDGKEAILAVFEAGNWFGEVSFIDGLPRAHDVMALGPCQLLRIPQRHSEELMGRTAVVHALALLQSMHLRGVYAIIDDETLRSMRARVARRLRRLARGDANPEAATERHVIVITQESLAMMLGITRQTLALELKTFVAQGAISIGYGRIEIESIDKLRQFEVDP